MRKPELIIWILEDDAGSRLVYEDILGLRYTIRFFMTIASFREALQASARKPDLIVADLRLPDGNLLDFLNDGLLGKSRGHPFIVVSSIDELDFFRGCFQSGALDYLPKPFTKNELISKVEKFLMSSSARVEVSGNGILLEPDKMRIRIRTIPEEYVQLTSKEYQLLSVLHQSQGAPVSRDRLHQEVWGTSAVSAKTLDVHLVHLRKKMARLKFGVRYVPDSGYLLQNLTQWDE